MKLKTLKGKCTRKCIEDGKRWKDVIAICLLSTKILLNCSYAKNGYARLEAFFLINYLFTMVMLGYDLEMSGDG